MNNQEKFIFITLDERNDIVQLLEAYKGIVDKTCLTLTKKHKPFQNHLLSQVVQCSKDVEKIINYLKERN